jgi:putative transposase
MDEWVVMPNHLHGILVLTDTPRGDVTDTLRRGDSRIAPTTHDATQPTSINDAIHPTLPKDTTSPTLNDASKHKPLGRLIGTFKTISTKGINQIRNTPSVPI